MHLDAAARESSDMISSYPDLIRVMFDIKIVPFHCTAFYTSPGMLGHSQNSSTTMLDVVNDSKKKHKRNSKLPVGISLT
jgi:hypothetical protein